MDALLIGAMLAAVLSGFIALVTSSALGAEIRAAEPEYAAHVFRHYADQLVFRRLPIRARVLFLEQPPTSVAPSVRILRWLYAVHYGTLALTVALVLAVFSGFAA
ncbi:hypothetical protein [Lysobacter humi (ex Lee et al. 2017)]